MIWVAVAFIALVGVVMFLQRRPLAHLQAAVLGGSILPGCVVAQAALLLLIAAVLVLAYLNDLL